MKSPCTTKEENILHLKDNSGKFLVALDIQNIEEFLDLYQTIAIEKGPLFDSTMPQHASSRWSFFSISPLCTYQKTEAGRLQLVDGKKTIPTKDFFDELNSFSFISPEKYANLKEFPFIGGFVGYVSYENNFDDIKIKDNKLQTFPLYHFSYFTNVFLFDHLNQKASLITEGKCESLHLYEKWKLHKISLPSTNLKLSEKIKLSPIISKEKYLSKIEEIFEHIRKGDIYQANFTQKFSGDLKGDPFSIYCNLRKRNPAPFACFYPINKIQFILSSSPERLFKVNNGKITSSPIKGTIRKDSDPLIDEKLKKDLLNSNKDAAELAMIIDLIRNDIGKISKFGSVKVLQYKKLESFQKVHHLIGSIEGVLKENITIKQIFEALFPGGSITGAPKIRSIEILNTLEEEARGPYTGSVGYIDIRGNMDFNIMIRTILIDKNSISLQVGGGIVIDSNPYCEYEETIHKAQAMFDAL